MSIAIVVDNNQQELSQTKKLLVESGAFETVIQFDDSLKAVEYIKLYGCDVVFTEVEMKGMNGFDLIRRLGSCNLIMVLVILTNKRNYALQAFEYNAADFIVKPIDKERIGRVAKKLHK